jgi:DNA polymerase III subunit chi
MPPRVDFYVSEEAGADVRLRLACRITEKAYAANQKVVVLLDADDVRRFDELLWTFGDGSFVPHDVVDATAAACEAPVALTTSSAPASHADVLINLSRAVPPWFEQFGRVAEFLDARPEVRAAGRDRFRAYKGKSIEPQTHKV